MTALFPTATPRTVAPYRNDVVGSFLRTDALKNAKTKLNAGEIDQTAYDVVLKEENWQIGHQTKTARLARCVRWRV